MREGPNRAENCEFAIDARFRGVVDSLNILKILNIMELSNSSNFEISLRNKRRNKCLEPLRSGDFRKERGRLLAPFRSLGTTLNVAIYNIQISHSRSLGPLFTF